MALTEKEIFRYKHPIAVPGMGIDMQEALKAARILIVGAGGLGSPILQYLSGAGVGVLGIADYGVILEEDLHRMPLYQMQDVRKHKAKMASSRLWALNPYAKHYPFLIQIKPGNVAQVIEGFDLIVDCSQHVPTHLVINDACVLQDKPFVIAEVHNWMAWFGGFNMPVLNNERSASYRCNTHVIDEYRNFDAGSLGPTHGATALQLATEIMKYIAGVPALAGKLYTCNFLHHQYGTVDLVPNVEIITEVKTVGILTAEIYGMEIVPDVED
ncbi:adenylyltransferase/sulfurtransferase [Chitinophaga skermanii]|uniref:Adenylyltransferase/sulfurtransferase n=1 Tax=Chitinophaga skermanii TaxID=331697 RepID=A0A327R1V5_9BACT|nr:HesA/MoeB/ThiF family protein [Chitinophaga skermanii]RAJ10829.1 adenylyltransferase/sulfurtransferase [Chitinophaga skermanii]